MTSPQRLAALCWLLATGATAAEVTATAFATAFDLRLDGSAPIQRVELDARVYAEAVSARLDDLVVLDGEGRRMATALRAPAPVRGDARPLPLFALPARAAQGTLLRSDEAVEIDLGDNGTVIRVRGDVADGTATRPPRAWLLDASAIAVPLQAITLDWNAVAEGGFVAGVRLEASDDLVAWRRLGVNGVLADLRNGRQHIRHRRLAFAPVTARYLRLTLEGDGAVPLSAAAAEPAAQHPPPPALRVEGWRGDAPQPFWQFDLEGPLPLLSAGPAWGEAAAVFEGRFLSADDPDGPWTEVGRGVLYTLEPVAGTPLVSQPVALRGAGRFLRVEIEAPAPDVPPALRLVLRPGTLYFLAAGRPPYRLLVGSASFRGRSDGALATLLADLGDDATVGDARLGVARVAGGAAARRPATPWDATPLLWGTLLLGVGVLAWMLRRLLRELRQAD